MKAFLSLLLVALTTAGWGCRRQEAGAPPIAAASERPTPNANEHEMPVMGETRSRYSHDSPVMQVLERASALPPSARRAPGFRFTWGSADRHAEGAVAMAASSALGVSMNGDDIHRSYCAHRTTSCTPGDLEQARGGRLLIDVRRVLGLGARADVTARCGDSDVLRVRDWADETLRSNRGGLVPVYVRDGFKDAEDGRPSSAHLFALYGMEGNGALLLRDAADRVPVTYRLRPERFCDALVAPVDALWGRAQSVYHAFAIELWTVASRSGQRPRPVAAAWEPVPTPPAPDVAPWSPEEGLPAMTVPGRKGDEPFDLGAFLAPPDLGAAYRRSFEGPDASPAELLLGVGISDQEAASSRGWLEKLEANRGVRRAGLDSFRYARHAQSPLAEAHQRAAQLELRAVGPLSARFRSAQTELGADDDWVRLAVVRFVQSIPYELVEEDVMGLRPPLGVLASYAGDCDSKALLAAVMLKHLGFDTAVVSSNAARHAVLGVVWPGRAGSTASAAGETYLLVEMTAARAPGDMTLSGLAGGDAGPAGWVATPLDGSFEGEQP